ncbi:MAG: hypothetical protein ACTSQJ_07275 [Promethearchaeota archaeon]
MKLEELHSNENDAKAFELIKEAKIGNLVKMSNMLVELFLKPELFKKYVKPKREGKIVEMEFPSIQDSIHVELTREKNKFIIKQGKPANSSAKIIVNVRREEIAKMIGRLSNNRGLKGFFFLLKSLITGKLKLKGSIASAVTFTKIMRINEKEIY